MRIVELAPGLQITFLISLNGEQLEFYSQIEEVLPKKRLVLAAPVYQNEKVLSFRGKGLIVDVLVTFEDIKPQLFKNVQVTLMKRSDGSFCYNLATVAESKAYNRRRYFRCYVGIPTSAMYVAHHSAHDAIIKDVSADGFSFVCDSSVVYEQKQLVHLVLNDYLEELAESFTFQLYGLIVRSYSLDDNRTVYGCRLNNKVAGLEAYIMKKERLRLRKTNGGRL